MWSQSGCKQFRRQLALEVGADLSADESLAAERHVAVCPSCREFREGLQDSQTALKRAAVLQFAARAGRVTAEGSEPARTGNSQAVPLRHGSLWSNVRERLPATPRRRRGDDYDLRNWAVAGLSLAVCVMLTLVLRTIPQSGTGNAGLVSDPVEFQRPIVPVVGHQDDAVPEALKGRRRPDAEKGK